MRDKIIKSFLKDITPEMFFIKFIKKRNFTDREEVINIIVELIDSKNDNILLKTKALIIIGFLYEMCCVVRKVSKYYESGQIICNFPKIPDTIEGNFVNFNLWLDRIENRDIFTNRELYRYINSLLICTIEYKIVSENTSKFITTIEKLIEEYEKEETNDSRFLKNLIQMLNKKKM